MFLAPTYCNGPIAQGSQELGPEVLSQAVSASSMTDPRLAVSWANLPKNRPSTEARREVARGPRSPHR